MKKPFLLFVSLTLILFFNESQAADYYWVGGTGNYNDSTHWATTSGGSTFQTYPPGIADDVYFDANSFLFGNDTMHFSLIAGPYVARNFTISGVLNLPTFVSDSGVFSINIRGNLSLDPNINWQVVCLIDFYSDQDTSSILTNGVHFKQIEFFNGIAPTSTYLLMDDIHCDYFTFEEGNLNTLNHNIYCQMFWLNSGDTLVFGTSNITASNNILLYSNGPESPLFLSDSAVFETEGAFETEYAHNIHYGSINASQVISDSCFYNVVYTSQIAGEGNHIVYLNGNINSLGTGSLGSAPNYITKLIASNYVLCQSNTVIDTLIFLSSGVYFGLYDTITVGELIMSNTPARRGWIQADQDSAYFNVTSGIVCLDFVDIDHIEAIGGAQFFAGYNSAAIGGTCSGWQFTACITNGGAWPGDANYDLNVNNLDILAIGLANGETGPTRAGASLSWVEQPVTDWANTFTSGINMKHSDCDGNGTVEPVDTAAVVLNYGLHHPAARMVFPEINPNSNSILTIDITTDTVGPSSPVHVNVDLGIDSIYGIAFSVYYNPALINSASLLTDASSSWLGTPGVNMICFAKADSAHGRIDFAITRTDNTDDISGSGHLLSFDLVTANNIPFATSLVFEVNDVSGIHHSQNYEAIGGAQDSSFIDSTLDVYNYNSIQYFSGYFSKQILALNFYSGRSENLNLSVFDIAGRELISEPTTAAFGINKKEIPIADLAKGIYIVTLSGEEGSESVKVVKE